MDVTYSTTTPEWNDTQNITLQKILQAGGGGGGGGGFGTDYNLTGVIDPVSAPANTAKAWTYTNTATPSFWVWPAGGAAWVEVV